jgi:hypothetical protein
MDSLTSGTEEGSHGESATAAEESSAPGSSPRRRWLCAYREVGKQWQLRAYRRRRLRAYRRWLRAYRSL